MSPGAATWTSRHALTHRAQEAACAHRLQIRPPLPASPGAPLAAAHPPWCADTADRPTGAADLVRALGHLRGPPAARSGVP